MLDVKTRNELNELYLTFCKVRTDFYFVLDSSLFFSKPEKDKPPIIVNLNAFVVDEIMDNEYVATHKDMLDLCLAFTKKVVPVLNSLFNTQFNPSTWASIPPNLFDSIY